MGFRTKMFLELFDNNTIFFFICHPLPVIFIHYKTRIAAAIRGLWWKKMTMVNAGLKGLNWYMYYMYLCMELSNSTVPIGGSSLPEWNVSGQPDYNGLFCTISRVGPYHFFLNLFVTSQDEITRYILLFPLCTPC